MILCDCLVFFCDASCLDCSLILRQPRLFTATSLPLSEGERVSEVAANDFGRLRIRLVRLL